MTADQRREVVRLLIATVMANVRASVCKWVPRSCRHGAVR